MKEYFPDVFTLHFMIPRAVCNKYKIKPGEHFVVYLLERTNTMITGLQVKGSCKVSGWHNGKYASEGTLEGSAAFQSPSKA